MGLSPSSTAKDSRIPTLSLDQSTGSPLQDFEQFGGVGHRLG